MPYLPETTIAATLREVTEGGLVLPAIQRKALMKLLLLDAAHELEELRVPPGNRLEALRGDRQGQHSIRINDQWRICFLWTPAGPRDVEIVDYH